MAGADPASADLAACFEQGLALLESQAWRPALERFSRGLAIDATRPGLWHNRAWCHLHLGDLDAARADLEALLGLQPGHPPGLALLGRIRLAQGDLDAGIDLLERAWMADPADALIARQALQALLLRPGAEVAAARRARILAGNAQLDPESARHLHAVLATSPDGSDALRALWAQLCTGTQAQTWMFEAWWNLCWPARQVDEAALAATLWLRHEPRSETAQRALMRALSARGDLQAAIAMALERAGAHPGDIEAMVELAACLIDAPDDSLRQAGLTVLAHASSLAPDDARPWLQRGHLHAGLFMHEEALEDFRTALRRMPLLGGARAGVVCSLAALGRHDEASRELQAFPVRDAPGRIERETARAFVLRTQGRVRQAESVLRDVLRHGGAASAEWELGCVLLTQGRYREGWMLWRGVAQERRPRPVWHRFVAQGARPWDGDLARARGRTLAVVSETGLGDALQFARFLPALQSQGVRVLLCVQGALTSLLGRTCPRLEVVDASGPLPPADLVCAVWDLPMLLDVRLAGLDRWGDAHYLHLDPAEVDAMGARLGPAAGLRVGLAWRGLRSPLAERSIALERIADLQIDGVAWFSLQRELLPGAEAEAARRMGLRHEGWTLDEAALAMVHMDCVVSIDTAYCHLAGSLGLPAQVLLPLACDWRWGTDAPATPWYPRATLLRQRDPGDWSGPLAELAAGLRRRVADRGAPGGSGAAG